MKEKIRILQVEDSGSDAALIVRLLEKSGYDVHSERVDDGAQLRAALAEDGWDVIIADYHLPQFDAPAALKVVQASGRDIPFLVVSGDIGEEQAVAMMKSGAHDYLMKGNLARLAPAVEREIREARTRRERKRIEERLALAVDATQLGTFDHFPLAGTAAWSDLAKRHFGLPPDADVSYETFLRGLHPDDRERVEAILRNAMRPEGGGRYTAEYRTIGIEDRAERWVSTWGRVLFDQEQRPVRFVGVTLDITERKRLEEQFRQAQKLEGLGRLAGGVAHDFNNLLTVITGYAQWVLGEMSRMHPLREPVDEIFKAAMRGTDLTRQLLAFSRRQISEPKNIALNDLVRNFEKLLRRLIGEDVELTLSLAEETGVIRADPGHIEQVIMNLAVNARDAMPAGGKVTIETSNFAADGPFVETHVNVAQGSYVMLTFTDTGVGMPAEVRAHIFEPFFTTKQQGTGLGLSTVYGIMQQSGGAILVESEPGAGTTFKLLFPAIAAPRDRDAAVSVQTAPLGKETILLVEDEAGVRKFVRDVLARHGYTVLEASNGCEGIEVARKFALPIDLLLVDAVMPEMGGAELIELFSAARCGVPVLCMSGYCDGAWPETRARTAYLQKPFTPAALLTQIRGLLDDSTAARAGS
jgi:PAS domain S-box-containing protein